MGISGDFIDRILRIDLSEEKLWTEDTFHVCRGGLCLWNEKPRKNVFPFSQG